MREIIELNLWLGARTSPIIRCAGVSLNTAHLHQNEHRRVLAETLAEVNLPAADPMRLGEAFEAPLDACLESSIR